MQALQPVAGRKARCVVVRIFESLLGECDFVREHRGREVLKRHRIFGNHYGFSRTDIGKPAAKEILLLFAGPRLGGQDAGPKLRHEQGVVRQRGKIAFLPGDDYLGEVARDELALRGNEFKVKGFGHLTRP